MMKIRVVHADGACLEGPIQSLIVPHGWMDGSGVGWVGGCMGGGKDGWKNVSPARTEKGREGKGKERRNVVLLDVKPGSEQHAELHSRQIGWPLSGGQEQIWNESDKATHGAVSLDSDN